MPKQKRTIPRCHSVPSFFEQPTSTWSIERFLLWHIKKCPGDEFRNATNRWVKSLSAISSCKRNCCTEEARKKAAELLQNYRSPGDGSDKSAASRFWSNRGTVNFGTIFQAPVGTASVSQTIHTTDSNVESRRDLGNQPQVIDTSAVNTGGEDAEDFDSLTFTALDKVYPDFEQVIEQFTAQYRAISEAGKLKLSTNTIVEDVIYQQSKDLAAIIQPHFWILDPDDPDVQSWFTTEEWDELKSKRLPLRRPDTNMVSQMAKFAGAKTLADYRAIAETPPPRPDGVYNFERDFDACWVNEVILKMVTLLERHDLLSSPDLQEGVFDSVIWSPLLDQCLLSLKGLLLQRKEITCRSLDSTLSTDPEFKFDGLVVSLTPRSNRRDRLEFAALEVSKASIAVESNKWVHDSMKVVVGLRAILSRLKRLAKGKDVRRLRVPGSVHAGLNARFAQMACVNENVYWLEWGQVRSVPTSVPMLKKVFELMISIWHFKTMIRDCFDAVQEHLNPEEQTQDELFEHLMARESGL